MLRPGFSQFIRPNDFKDTTWWLRNSKLCSRRFYLTNMFLTLLTLIAVFLFDRILGKAIDSQRNNKDFVKKDSRGMQCAKEMLWSDQSRDPTSNPSTTPSSQFSHHLQRLFKDDWYVRVSGIVVWGSTASSNNFMPRILQARVDCWFYSNNLKSFAATSFEQSWCSCTSVEFASWFQVQVDCYFLQNPSLLRRLRNILWGRKRWTWHLWPRWYWRPWHPRPPWPWPCWPHWPWLYCHVG